MIWKEITTLAEVNELKQNSVLNPEQSFVIFKHSTRCGTSRMAKNLFESQWNINDQVHLVNVVEFRAASNAVTDQFKTEHESPQVLVIKNGQSIYANSHSSIDAVEIIRLLQSEPV